MDGWKKIPLIIAAAALVLLLMVCYLWLESKLNPNQDPWGGQEFIGADYDVDTRILTFHTAGGGERTVRLGQTSMTLDPQTAYVARLRSAPTAADFTTGGVGVSGTATGRPPLAVDMTAGQRPANNGHIYFAVPDSVVLTRVTAPEISVLGPVNLCDGIIADCEDGTAITIEGADYEWVRTSQVWYGDAAYTWELTWREK